MPITQRITNYFTFNSLDKYIRKNFKTHPGHHVSLFYKKMSFKNFKLRFELCKSGVILDIKSDSRLSVLPSLPYSLGQRFTRQKFHINTGTTLNSGYNYGCLKQ
jgi:hypothetical protein